MSTSVLLVVVSITIASAITLRWYLSPTRELRHLVRTAPRRSVQDALDGAWVRIVGRVVVGPTIEAPLSGEACVSFAATVERYNQTSQGRKWSEVGREAGGVELVIEDETGSAVIDASGARVLLQGAHDAVVRYHAASARQKALLARTKPAWTWDAQHELRFREVRISVGDRIAVVGIAVRAVDPSADQGSGDREAPSRLRVRGTEKVILLLSNTPTALR